MEREMGRFQKWWFCLQKQWHQKVVWREKGGTFKSGCFFAKTVAPVRGMERERGHFQKWWFCLQKQCTSKGYGERERALSKVVVLFTKTVAPVRGKERGKFLLLLSREGGTFSVLPLLAFQTWWFCLQNQWHPKGYGEGKFLSLRSRKREAHFQGSLCSLSKSGGFICKKSGTCWYLVKVW